MANASKDLLSAAEVVVKSCLAVKPGEHFLIITDTEKRTIAEAIFEAGLKQGAEAMIVVIKPRTRNGEEPPKPIAEMWKQVDVYVAPTKYSLTHTQARKQATERGARGATMPGITEDMFVRTMGIDYEVVREYVEKMYEAVKNCKEVRVTSPSGTDITIPRGKRSFFKDTGIYHNKGDFGNLPAGEVYLAPEEGRASGRIVFDGAVAGVGVLKKPVEVVVERGYAVEFRGGDEADALKKLLESVGKREAFNLAELGIGCNPSAKITGYVLEDEKVFGTVHMAFGDNSTIGGVVQAGIHIDGIITEPTLEADGRVLIRDGKWLI